jgi:hypothetical protein
MREMNGMPNPPLNPHPLPPPQLAGSIESYGNGGKLSLITVHLFSSRYILELWVALNGGLAEQKPPPPPELWVALNGGLAEQKPPPPPESRN